MTAQDVDLDEIARQLGARSTHDVFQEIEDARRAAEMAPPPEPTIIPMPEYPHRWPHALAGTVRFPCTALGGCSWAYDVDSTMEPVEPLVIPLGASVDELNQLLNEQAERRSTRLRSRIETAFREHFRQVHPGQEPPQRVPR